ncbi:uncharacterized protein LOC141632550 [Silene latifolia]|uniref:uncharacterized protein LOC141632550 n=1 Tax=Silene latifolia TaxID=37657 RepID=UPI003D789833
MEQVIYDRLDYEYHQGRQFIVCRVCKGRFKSLKPLSHHLLSSHQMILSVKSRRDDSDEDDGDDDDDDDNDDYESESESDEEEGKEIWFTRENLALNCRLNAEAALEYFNDKDGGKKYELVEHGPTMATNPAIWHLNFKAKEKDCPDAPVETFFAQMKYFRGMEDVVCCVSLGPSHELPHWRKAELGGCKLCKGIINHPTVKVDNLTLR